MKKTIPAVIYKLRFIYNAKSDYGGYINYMNRPEAFNLTKHENDNLYSGHLDYMRNDEKSDGLFDCTKNLLNDSERLEYQKNFNNSQEKNCPLYQSVISFNNEFLRENNILDGDILDKNKLKEHARLGVAEMLNKSHLDPANVVWIGAIHTNTDNIHIHISFTEKEKIKRNKDKIDVKAFDKLKSKVVNCVIGNEHIKRIDEILRNDMMKSVTDDIHSNTHIIDTLIEELPDIIWQYNRKEMIPYQDKIKNAVNGIIESNPILKQKFDFALKELDKYSKFTKELYGTGKRDLYRQTYANKINDFYSRTGNVLLKHMISVRKELSKRNFDIDNVKKCQVKDKLKKHVNIDNYNITRLSNQIKNSIHKLDKEFEYELDKLIKEFTYEQEHNKRKSY